MSGLHVRKILLGALALVGTSLVFMAWYRLHYSMDAARAFEVAGAPGGAKTLIATQGSAFKDAITAGLVEHLRRRSASARVIDVAGLGSIQPEDWDVIVVIHTWEMRKPPAAVQAFADRTRQKDNIVVLTTSGAGDFKLAGVDAISAASQMADVPQLLEEMTVRIDAILDRESSALTRADPAVPARSGTAH